MHVLLLVHKCCPEQGVKWATAEKRDCNTLPFIFPHATLYFEIFIFSGEFVERMSMSRTDHALPITLMKGAQLIPLEVGAENDGLIISE